MSFFDRLGERLSETGSDIGKIVSDTTQRAKESSRAVSLKKQIREEEDKINQTILYIMRLYLRDAREEEFLYPDMLRLVRESEQKVANYYHEIELLQMERPMMQPQGQEMGQPQPPQEQSEMSQVPQEELPANCPTCGYPVSEGSVFCANCGTKLR